MAKSNSKRTRQSGLKRWKTFNEKEVLEWYFILDPNWTRKTIDYLKTVVRLSENQIYKWGYERKKKLRLLNDAALERSFSQNTGIEDLTASHDSQDYNNIVNELFPTGQDMSDELTDNQESLYNRVRDELMSKDVELQKMSDIDKLLCERIKTSDVVHNVKNIANEAQIMRIETKQRQVCASSPIKTQNNSFEESFSCSTLARSRNKREAKAESKHIDDFPIFNEFEVIDRCVDEPAESSIFFLDKSESESSSILDKEIDGLFQVYDPFSLFNED